jgi:hypothetical protein
MPEENSWNLTDNTTDNETDHHEENNYNESSNLNESTWDNDTVSYNNESTWDNETVYENETVDFNETENTNGSDSNQNETDPESPDEEEFDGNYIDISIGDFKLELSSSQGDKLVEMRARFAEYFDWALVQGEEDQAAELGTCSEECTMDEQRDMCCTTIKMYESKGKAKFIQHQCMNSAVVDVSSGLWIDDFFFEYQCQEGEWLDGKKSSAASLAVGLGGLLLAASFM